MFGEPFEALSAATPNVRCHTQPVGRRVTITGDARRRVNVIHPFARGIRAAPGLRSGAYSQPSAGPATLCAGREDRRSSSGLPVETLLPHHEAEPAPGYLSLQRRFHMFRPSRFPTASQRTSPVATVRRLIPAAWLAVSALLAGCAPSGPPEMPPPEVNVAVVAAKPIVEWDTYDGRIAAIETVELRPRVTGYLAGVHFREGGEVEKGALLFTVDDREYRAALVSAQANTARAATRVEVARTEYARAEKLEAARAVSEEELETRRGERLQAEADLKAAQAQQRQAELNMEFTRIRAPIAGYVSSAAVRPGNLVTAGQTPLTTIVSVDPVYVEFEGDERMYLKYQAMSRNGERPSSRDARNPVRVALADEQGYPHEGEMVFVDNALDPGTGTIRARAVLPNADRVFTPGMFARVQLLGSGEHDTILVNERALLTDQDRRYVYVVGDDGKAMRRDVQLGGEAEGLRIVREGLKPGDRVVVNGVRKIFFPGMPVKPAVVPMDQPDFAPSQAGGSGNAEAGDAAAAAKRGEPASADASAARETPVDESTDAR